MYQWTVTLSNGEKIHIKAQDVEVGEYLVFYDTNGLVVRAFTPGRWIEIEKLAGVAV